MVGYPLSRWNVPRWKKPRPALGCRWTLFDCRCCRKLDWSFTPSPGDQPKICKEIWLSIYNWKLHETCRFDQLFGEPTTVDRPMVWHKPYSLQAAFCWFGWIKLCSIVFANLQTVDDGYKKVRRRYTGTTATSALHNDVQNRSQTNVRYPE